MDYIIEPDPFILKYMIPSLFNNKTWHSDKRELVFPSGMEIQYLFCFGIRSHAGCDLVFMLICSD